MDSVKPNYFRLFVILAMVVTGFTLGAAYAFVCAFIYLEPTLPSVAAMKNNELAVPLRVYTRSGELIAQIGEQRRNPVGYENSVRRNRSTLHPWSRARALHHDDSDSGSGFPLRSAGDR